MIQRIDRLPNGLPENVALCRINALYTTYQDSVGIDIFAQTVDGKMTAVFGGMDGSLSLIAFDGADYDELSAYFSLLQATVFCFGHTAQHLQCRKKQFSNLYVLTANVTVLQNNSYGRIAEVYEALQKGLDGDIALPPFDFWYTDFCVRFNHGSAEYALCDGAVAVAGFVTEDSTLITGVATDPACRKVGLASAALKTLLSNIKKKHPSSRVFAATSNADGFYIKNGFTKCDTVAVCEYQEI